MYVYFFSGRGLENAGIEAWTYLAAAYAKILIFFASVLVSYGISR